MKWDETAEKGKEQLRRIRFYENWRVSAGLGVIVGIGVTLLMQAIF